MKQGIIALLVLFMACTASAQGEESDTMKIKISNDTTVLTATMRDNPTSRDFLSLLPLTLTLEDYAGTEKVSDLPRKLSTQGAPSGSDPDVGDITLYAPWGNLALFYQDFGYASGLIIIGRIDDGIDDLAQLEGEVKFERIE